MRAIKSFEKKKEKKKEEKRKIRRERNHFSFLWTVSIFAILEILEYFGTRSAW